MDKSGKEEKDRNRVSAHNPVGTSCRFLGGVRGNGVGIGMEDPVAAPLSKQDHQYEKVQALVTVYTIKQKPTKQQTKVLAHFELSVYFPEHLKTCNCNSRL